MTDCEVEHGFIYTDYKNNTKKCSRCGKEMGSW
jgi:hypothetical protein